MTYTIYASRLISCAPKVWSLPLGANVTIDLSVPGVRRLGECFRDDPVQGLIVDYRAALIFQRPFKYSELALSVSIHLPPTTLIGYITGPRNCQKAALMIMLLRDRHFAARGFQRWGAFAEWMSCPPTMMDPIPRNASNVLKV